VGVWALLSFVIGFLPLSPSELAFLPVIIGVFLIRDIGTALTIAVIIELCILILNNAILPRITAGKETNPLLILVSVFAAINMFGFAGFVIGPVFVYLMMAFYKIADARLVSEKPRYILEL
jgi:predicted PurR-regulated permease PerM